MADLRHGIDDDQSTQSGFYHCSSNDSSFCGNEDTKSQCAAELASFNPLDYWVVHQGNFRCVTTQEQYRSSINAGRQIVVQQETTKRKHTGQSPCSQEEYRINKKIKKEGDSSPNLKAITTTPPPPNKSTSAGGKDYLPLFNPYEGNPRAYQLEESIDEFLDRLRPSQTTVETGGGGGPWIWIANPHSSHRPASEDVAGFKQAGNNLLRAYINSTNTYKNSIDTSPNNPVVRGKLQAARSRLEAELLMLAQAKNITTGKWMLFVSPAEVDWIWGVVAKATLDGQLGCAAKVAAGPAPVDTDYREKVSINSYGHSTSRGGGSAAKQDRERLICIYTENFSDRERTKQVLLKMKEAGLPVDGRDGRGIYYKCDAFTYLDIFSGNEYGLRASMHCSRDLHGSGSVGAGRRRYGW